MGSHEDLREAIEILSGGRYPPFADEGTVPVRVTLPLVDITTFERSLANGDFLAVRRYCLKPPFTEYAIGFAAIWGGEVIGIVESEEVAGEGWFQTLRLYQVARDRYERTPALLGRWRMTLTADGRLSSGTSDRYRAAGVDNEYVQQHFNVLLAGLDVLYAHPDLELRQAATNGPFWRREKKLRHGAVLTIVDSQRRRGSSRRSTEEPLGSPVVSVRASEAHYGDCCPGEHAPHGFFFAREGDSRIVWRHEIGTADGRTLVVKRRIR